MNESLFLTLINIIISGNSLLPESSWNLLSNSFFWLVLSSSFGKFDFTFEERGKGSKSDYGLVLKIIFGDDWFMNCLFGWWSFANGWMIFTFFSHFFTIKFQGNTKFIVEHYEVTSIQLWTCKYSVHRYWIYNIYFFSFYYYLLMYLLIINDKIY